MLSLVGRTLLRHAIPISRVNSAVHQSIDNLTNNYTGVRLEGLLPKIYDPHNPVAGKVAYKKLYFDEKKLFTTRTWELRDLWRHETKRSTQR